METIYIQHFLRQLDHATTQGSVLERSLVTTATEKYLFSLQPHIKEDLILFITYLPADSETTFGFRGIMKNDTLIDAGVSNPKCISLITRPCKGQGDVLASLCIKASASVLSDIFGSKDAEIKLALADPTPTVYTRESTPQVKPVAITVTPKETERHTAPFEPQVQSTSEPVKVEYTDAELEKLTAPVAPSATSTAVLSHETPLPKINPKEVLTPKKKQQVYTKPN